MGSQQCQWEGISRASHPTCLSKQHSVSLATALSSQGMKTSQDTDATAPAGDQQCISLTVKESLLMSSFEPLSWFQLGYS